MQIIGCDLHARQQTLAVLDTTTGEVMEKTLTHSGNDRQDCCGPWFTGGSLTIQAVGANLMSGFRSIITAVHTGSPG
jgi:hypothetical protein